MLVKHSLTCLSMARTTNLLLFRTFMPSYPVKSALAPTYSSTGDTSKIVTKLGFPRIATMIITGKPNRPPPPQFQVDLDEFLPGAISAAGVVTSSMYAGDWNSLEGLVDRDCISSLQSTMQSMNSEQKELSVINPDDVFFSFVSNLEDCDSGNNLHVVTFSLPNLSRMKQMIKENKEFENEAKQNIQQSEAKAEEVISIIKKVKEKADENDPHELFKANEIVIGNFRFIRDSSSGQWTITEVAQMNSLEAWATMFKLRWKGRLGIALRGGMDFNKVLRVDYSTDYVTFSIIFASFYVQQMM